MGKRSQIPLGILLGLVLFGVVFAYNKYITDFVAYIILALLLVLLGLSIYRRKWMAFTISFVSSAVVFRFDAFVDCIRILVNV